MKAKWIIMLCVLAALIILGILQETKIIDIKWQMLSILVAGLIAPFKFLASLLTPRKDKIQAIKDEHEALRDQEQQYQQQLEARVKDREAKVDMLNKQIDVLNARVGVLEEKSKQVDTMVNNMSIDEKKDAFTDLFGK